MRTVMFYGDSNTYGFDPRGFSGGRYPVSEIWTTLVAEGMGDDWRVENHGLNGRTIPTPMSGLAYAGTLLEKLRPCDVFAFMLGSNDILMQEHPDGEAAALRMAEFFEWLTARHPAENILQIFPVLPGRESDNDALYELFRKESRRMNAFFRIIAERCGIRYADASEWNIELAYDLDHFSKAGHREFARNILIKMQEFE